MRESSIELNGALQVWRRWAATASRDYDGWESDAPNWNDVIGHAQVLLMQPDLDTAEISQIESVFSLSEESEELADFVKDNYEDIPRTTILALAGSGHSQIRWQIYDSLVKPDEFGSALLHQGVEDPDDYVRRRAFLRLLSIERPVQSILERAANDTDAVIRAQAKSMLEWT